MRHTPILLLCVLTLAAPARAKPETKSLEDRISEVARPYVDSGVLMGVVIGVIDGKEQVISGLGRLSDKRSASPDGDTIFEIGSITKVFTGVMLASLVEEGLVTLDEPVQALLPRGVIVPARATDEGSKKITLVDLSTHTSGLPRMPSNFNPPDAKRPYLHYTSEALYAFLSAHMLRRLPGDSYEYSNLAAGLLGHALGLRAKQTYTAMLRSRITRPLGISFTHLEVPQVAEANVAPPHTADGIPTEPWDFATLTGAGAIRSNVNDMLVFARANLAPDDSPLGKALKLAQRIHWKPKTAGAPSMGLGWHAGAGAQRWHNGQTGGYHSFVSIDPGKQRAIVLLSNTSTGQVDRLAKTIASLLDGKTVEAPKFEMPVTLSADQLDACVGTFEITPAFKITVTRERNRLMALATGPGQGKLRLWPKSATEFFVRAVEARVTFHTNDAGKIIALTLFQNGKEMRGKKTD